MLKSFGKSLVVGTLAAGLALAAGAAAAQGTPVNFQLNWMAGGPNAGFAAAVAEGYYKDAGLNVTLVQGNGSGNTAQLVANGRSQLAYAAPHPPGGVLVERGEHELPLLRGDAGQVGGGVGGCGHGAGT